MNIEHFKKRLLDEERELDGRVAASKAEGRASGEVEVKDPADDAIASEGAAETFAEGEVLSQTLRQVRDALQRIENGTYGKCMECGRPIEPARLEAIPWTPYCREDQEKLEQSGADSELPR